MFGQILFQVKKKVMDLLQERLTMFNMDVKSKGITWVDNMYQKIESICLDVDKNLLLQETTKYVESQVQTVGINVRRFCAEVVQDLLPPPLENPVKGPISDLSLTYEDDIGTCYKSKISLEDSPALNKKPSLPAELGGTLPTNNDLAPPSLSNRSQEKNQDISDKLPQNPNPVLLEVTGCGCEDNEAKPDNRGSTPAPLDGNLSAEEIVSFRALEPTTEIADNDLEHHVQSTVLDDTDEFGSSNKSVGEEAMEALNEIEQCSKAIKEHDNLENQKICGVNSKAFCVISRPTDRTKAFKKKLKRAFTSKLPSPKQKEPEELAYWYEDVDMETKLRGGISPSYSIVSDPGAEKLQILDPSESDWELL